jgi:acyl carrier protein
MGVHCDFLRAYRFRLNEGAENGKYGSQACRRNPATRYPQAKEFMSDIAVRVKKIIIDNLGVDGDKVSDRASFTEDLSADSLEMMELVVAFEEEFDLAIPDEASDSILTVGDAVRYIERVVSDR